jgi:quinol monooxygenase YgiN
LVVIDQIRVNAKFRHVPPGTLEEFRLAAARALEVAKGEAGTLQYDWFFNDDQTVCVVHEAYADSAAVLAHIGNLGEVLGRILETGGGCSFEVLGNPSPELRDAFSGLDVTVFAVFQGK